MPTRADFEAAAELFDQAAAGASELAHAVGGASIDRVVKGGLLAEQLASSVQESAASAHSCAAMIGQAADVCRVRAAIIAAYEGELARYDVTVAAYRHRMSRWRMRYRLWWTSPFEFGHPGSQPRPPTPPIAPPMWADVRRP